MGQWMYYVPVSESELARLLADPSTAVDFLYGDGIKARKFTTEKTWNALDYLLSEGEHGDDLHIGGVIEGGTAIPGGRLRRAVAVFHCGRSDRHRRGVA